MTTRRWILLALVGLTSACTDQSDISFFVLVKSSNYAQDSEGQLELLNYHFFSEIFLQPGGTLTSAVLRPTGDSDRSWTYVARDTNYYFEGGHFESVEAVDRAYPNGSFSFSITTPSVELEEVVLVLQSPTGETDIPAPIEISLWQEDVVVHPLAVDPSKELVFRWSAFSNGADDPRGIVDDMIFVVVADCQGERIVHTGLPFQGEYTTHRTTEMRVPVGLLKDGQPYSAFVEFPHVVDSTIEQGVPGFTSFATATYLDLRTTGAEDDQGCPELPPPMDTGQTDRMEVGAP